LLGADLAYLGTRFIATRESLAPQAYKDMLLSSSAVDIVHTAAVSGVPASFMRQSLENAGFDLPALQGKGNAGSRLKPVDDEAKAWKTVWSAGQGVGGITDLPTVEALIQRLDAEYREAQLASTRLAGHWPR
jgi:nitronate monooxygenase